MYWRINGLSLHIYPDLYGHTRNELNWSEIFIVKYTRVILKSTSAIPEEVYIYVFNDILDNWRISLMTEWSKYLFHSVHIVICSWSSISTNISSRFSRNSEANVSEFLENMEWQFPKCYIHSDVCSMFTPSCTLHSVVRYPDAKE